MSDQKYIVGVDLGGTSIKVGVVPYDGGKVLGMRSMPTNSDHGAKFVVDRMVEMIRGCMQDAAHEENIPEEGFIGIGLGSPGPLDRKTGTVIETPNLGWRNFPLRDLISNSIGLEAELDNDANCATTGEWWMGAGQGVQTLIGVTLGNDVNLRDFEGRSALLLGRSKDNNASCAIGPFLRLFDESFDIKDVRNCEIALQVVLDLQPGVVEVAQPVDQLMLDLGHLGGGYPGDVVRGELRDGVDGGAGGAGRGDHAGNLPATP